MLRVLAKFGGFRHSVGGQNFGVAGNFGGILSSSGGFAEKSLVTLRNSFANRVWLTRMANAFRTPNS